MKKHLHILAFLFICILLSNGAFGQSVNLPTSGAATSNACGNAVTVYDNGGSGSNYSNSSSGYIVLQSGGTAVINISGSYNTESGYDYVYIYSGSGTGGTLLASYNGSGTINYTGTAGQTLTIQLSSDGSVNFSGISLNVTYSGTCPSTINIPASGSSTVTCGTSETVYLNNGAANYSDGDNGYTVFSCSGTGQISISGNYVVESGYDYVYVYLGSGTGGSQIAGSPFTGSGSISYTAAVGQAITIKFTSDGSVDYSGTAISVNYITSCCVPPVVAAIGGGAATICLGNSSSAFTDATAGGTWSIINGTGSATIDATGVVSGVTVGTATVNYAVTSGGCTTTVTYAITVSDVVYVAAIGGGAASVCVGSSTPAFTDATGGGTWSVINGTGSATITAGGVVTGVSVGSITVNYAVTNSCGTVNVTYGVTVTSGCSGTPTGGTALASVTSGCGVSYSSTLSLSGNTIGCGISYQWYSSPNNSTWTIIGGATSSTYVATVSANTYYECILTCSNGGATGTSSSVYCSYSLANDACAGATNMTFVSGINIGDYIATIQGDNSCATADGTSQCFTVNKSVWFKFTAPAAGNYGVTLESGGTMKYPELAIKTGTCAGLTEVCCAGVDNASGNIWESPNPPTYFPVNKYSPYSYCTKYYTEGGICGVTAGQTVYIMVDDYQTAGTFTLTVATLVNDAIPSGVVVANCGAVFNSSTIGATNCDNCSGTPIGGGEPATVGIMNNFDCAATVCSGSSGGSCGSGSGGSGSAANASFAVNGGDVGYSVENDSWYQFCVTASTTVTVAFSPVASSCLPSSGHGGSSGLQISIFTGTPTSLTKVSGGYNAMSVTGTYNATYAMTASQCSYIEVDGFAGTNCNYNLTINMTPSCVLPVEMLYFNGVLTDDIRVKLDWASAVEKNADHYVIERSSDGIDYVEIGTMKAKGNSDRQSSYLMYDNSPAKGRNYYRLSEIDKNGKSNFLGYATVSNKASLPILNLYPNPAQNSIMLSLKNFSVPTISYELYDAKGILVGTETINLVDGNQDYKIDLSQLNNGFYFIKVNTGEELLKRTFVKSE